MIDVSSVSSGSLNFDPVSLLMLRRFSSLFAAESRKMTTAAAYSWSDLKQLAALNPGRDLHDPNGPASAQANLRLFGKEEKDVRVTLYRDNHSWCPYCQLVLDLGA